MSPGILYGERISLTDGRNGRERARRIALDFNLSRREP